MLGWPINPDPPFPLERDWRKAVLWARKKDWTFQLKKIHIGLGSPKLHFSDKKKSCLVGVEAEKLKGHRWPGRRAVPNPQHFHRERQQSRHTHTHTNWLFYCRQKKITKFILPQQNSLPLYTVHPCPGRSRYEAITIGGGNISRCCTHRHKSRPPAFLVFRFQNLSPTSFDKRQLLSSAGQTEENGRFIPM